MPKNYLQRFGSGKTFPEENPYIQRKRCKQTNKQTEDCDLDTPLSPLSSEEHCKVTVHFQDFDTTSLNLNL